MTNFFAELKRRHIYRVGAAYAVVAWVLLQLANNIVPILDLPVWVARTILLLLVLGFPIALLLSVLTWMQAAVWHNSGWVRAVLWRPLPVETICIAVAAGCWARCVGAAAARNRDAD